MDWSMPEALAGRQFSLVNNIPQRKPKELVRSPISWGKAEGNAPFMMGGASISAAGYRERGQALP